jgi:hypothetical protein
VFTPRRREENAQYADRKSGGEDHDKYASPTFAARRSSRVAVVVV